MPEPTDYNRSQHAETPLVLVVDDDKGIRLLLRQMMEQEGYSVIEAENGRQALDLYQDLQPEIVFLDVLMPVMDGLTCCQELQALHDNQPAIVMVTNLTDVDSVDRAFAAGATDYISKPIQRAILRQKLLKITQQFRLVKQLQQTKAELRAYIQTCNITLEERTAQLQKALALETLFRQITDRLQDLLDETQIMQTAVDELVIALGLVRCNAGLYDSEQRVASIHNRSALLPVLYPDRVLQTDELTEIYQQLLQGYLVQFCPIGSPPFQKQNSLVVFPVVHKEQLIGDLWLVCKAQRTLDSLEVCLVKQVANQCGIAIWQARLYHTAQVQVKELERLNQVKDDFLNTVSHELRSPMVNIRMAVQMLDRLTTQIEEQYGDVVLQNSNYAKGLTCFQIIQTECNREITFINDLLDLQRLESGEQPAYSTLIAIEEWLPHVIQPFLERAQQQQQTLQIHLTADLPPIQSDPSSLHRILTELLHNACKYTPPDETITVSISFHANFNRFQIRVTNTGIEIPIEEHDRIFDKFYRIPDGDRWKQGGTGLGLALVKRLVESLGGSIQVESVTQQTCFTVQIPSSIPDSDSSNS